jgi:hypothetical protein
MENICYAHSNQRKDGVITLVPEEADIKVKTTVMHKMPFYNNIINFKST